MRMIPVCPSLIGDGEVICERIVGRDGTLVHECAYHNQTSVLYGTTEKKKTNLHPSRLSHSEIYHASAISQNHLYYIMTEAE